MSKVFSHCYIAESSDSCNCFENNRLYFKDYTSIDDLLKKADSIITDLEIEHYPKEFNLVIHRDLN
jgi:hypothetical protein